jgi:DNA-binding transcriptional LysR family regulator
VFLRHAERVTEAAGDALTSVGRRQAAHERAVTIGTFRNAPYYGIAGLAARYCERHPDARLRMQGQNSFDVARAVQDGELEAGLVVLPVDDSMLDVQTLFRDEVLLVSSDPDHTRGPARIARVAETPLILYDTTHGFRDPTRRQLAALAQAAGVTLEPRIEVEHVETALQLVARGLGDTIAARAVLARSALPANVKGVGFAEPFHDSFALITRRGVRLSPGTQALVELLDDWARTVAASL